MLGFGGVRSRSCMYGTLQKTYVFTFLRIRIRCRILKHSVGVNAYENTAPCTWGEPSESVFGLPYSDSQTPPSMATLLREALVTAGAMIAPLRNLDDAASLFFAVAAEAADVPHRAARLASRLGAGLEHAVASSSRSAGRRDDGYAQGVRIAGAAARVRQDDVLHGPRRLRRVPRAQLAHHPVR